MSNAQQQRSLGLLGATLIGVGAIVGGGILALAGVAFSTTGPGALLAFGLNGIIALLTALSFAEMSTAFPQSGGAYTFARKVLTVQAAFAVGWVVWFASIVASVLYALGFAAYAVVALKQLWPQPYPQWLDQQSGITLIALGATALYTLSLFRKNSGGGQWETIGKVVVFAVLIFGGAWALGVRPEAIGNLSREAFLPRGGTGLFQAMGYTFIALQGYDLIAAVAGEVRDPGRNLPRAILWSLAIALVIYLPLLLIIATVGLEPGQTATQMGSRYPETIIAVAAQNYLGPTGYWLVVLAAILSMLSALYANLFAASRVALAMARDRTLPHFFSRISRGRGTPNMAVLLSAAFVGTILLVIPDLAAAGAAASLIFLLSFALAHWTSILARRRGTAQQSTFRVPWFPLVPVLGATSCAGLAIFQGITVPAAGLVASVWLGAGGILYLVILARRARIVDAAAEAKDPQLMQLRGRSPLVLVPIANPANAAAMVATAHALAPPGAGRVLLLSVVAPPTAWHPGQSPPQLVDAQTILRESLTASFAAGLSPEALITIAPMPWSEIGRVSRTHACESLLMGLTDLSEELAGNHLEELLSSTDCDLSLLRAGPGWDPAKVRRILVPIGGQKVHATLRARFLASLCRTGPRQITFLRVLPRHTTQRMVEKAQRELQRSADDKAVGHSRVEVVLSDEVGAEVVRRSAETDLIILGLQRLGRRQKAFGALTLHVVRNTDCAVIMISQQG